MTPDPNTKPSGNPVSSTPLSKAPLTSSETPFYEGGPARGDLILNLLFGLTVIGIPFAVGAIVRALWLRFRITSRRVSVTAGWMGRDRSQVAYGQIKEVRSIPRGLGFWGDMVLVLSDGARLEMRAIPRFRETEAYIKEQIAARIPAAPNGFGSPQAVNA